MLKLPLERALSTASCWSLLVIQWWYVFVCIDTECPIIFAATVFGRPIKIVLTAQACLKSYGVKGILYLLNCSDTLLPICWRVVSFRSVLILGSKQEVSVTLSSWNNPTHSGWNGQTWCSPVFVFGKTRSILSPPFFKQVKSLKKTSWFLSP